MILNAVLAAAGLVLLTVAADQLVIGSSRLATAMRVSPVVVGVVVIGLGTSAPEFLVSGVAAANGESGIAVGNIAGSNILNLTLILGIAALVAPVKVRSNVVNRELPLAVGAVALLSVLAWLGLDPVAAAVLLIALVATLLLLVRWARAGAEPPLAAEVAEFEGPRPPRRGGFEAVRALLGLAGVLAGAEVLVANASSIASRFNVPQVVIGFTLVALGTSLPELVTTIQAQRRRETDLVVGNLFGSNLFNSLAGGAVVGLAASGGGRVVVAPVLLLAMPTTSLLAWALLRRRFGLVRFEAVLLLVTYAVVVPMLLR